jgi:hypothetical protein
LLLESQAIAVQLPAALGSFHRGNCSNDTNTTDRLEICYRDAGGDIITYDGQRFARAADAHADVASSMSTYGGPFVAKTIDGITYTDTRVNQGNAHTVFWQYGRVSLDVNAVGTTMSTATAISLAAEAQAHTKFS